MAAKEPNDDISRRKVIRTIGATGVAGAGLAVTSGPVAAESEHDPAIEELEEKYSDQEAIQKAIDEHAEGILEVLSELDVIDEPSAAALPTSRFIEGNDVESEGGDGVSVSATVEEEEPTGFIGVSQTTDHHDLSLYVQPEREDAYAYLKTSDGTSLIRNDTSDDELSTLSEEGSLTTLSECEEVCYEARCTSESCYIFWNVGIDYRCCVDEDGNEECNQTMWSGCGCDNRVCE